MLPMVLNIALFSIQPGVMPFQMNFTAFIISYFALASVVCVVWVLLVQWDTLVRLVRHALGRLDSAVHMSPSGAGSNPTAGDEPENEPKADDINAYGDRNWLRGILYTAGKSISRQLKLVRRGGGGNPEAEPAGLASVVYD